MLRRSTCLDMQYLGSLRYYVLFIFILSMFIYVTNGNSSHGCFNCLTTRSTFNETFNGTILSEETAKLLLSGDVNATREIPEAPKHLKTKVNDGELMISWIANPFALYGLKYLTHIVLMLEHFYSPNETYRRFEYILFNVSGVNSTTIFSYKYPKLRPATFEIRVTLWFSGKFIYSNGHLVAPVDDLSKSETAVVPRQQLLPDLIAAKNYTERCICGSIISLNIAQLARVAAVRANIQAFDLPNDTKVEIQLIRNNKIEERINITGLELIKTFIKNFKTKKFGSYFVRVLRHCRRKYEGSLSCGKDEADVIRSETETLTGSYSSRSTRTSSSVDVFEGIDIFQVLQVAAITLAFAISIIIELALIFLMFTVMFCHKRKSAIKVERSTYVRINDRGGTETKLIASKRVAIIFAKDSSGHQESVERINNALIRRGIDSVLYDETNSQEIMANWGQAAENIVTNYDVILFVITPLLYNICKKESILPLNGEEGEEGTKDSRTKKHIFTRFPSAVLNALKNRTVWAVSNKARCVSICFAETKEEFERLSAKMRQEHPLVFKDKIYFNNLRHDYDSNNRKQIQKLIRAINLK